MSLFVTGTDTGVGKTHTVVQMLRLLRRAGRRCAGFKPICCGDRGDARLLLEASAPGLTLDDVNPIWLKMPAAPFVASVAEDCQVDILRVRDALESLRANVDVVLVEGVGGWLVPIRADYFVSDLAAEMGFPVLVVVANKLGCLNHTMLTVRSIRDGGQAIAAIVLNDVGGADPDVAKTNFHALGNMLPAVPILHSLPPNAEEFPPEWRPLFAVSSNVG